MLKPYIGYGLAGERHVKRLDGKWFFDEPKYDDEVRQISNAGDDVWREIPWSVWGVSKIEDVFCAFGITDGKFDLSKWNEDWFKITRRKIEILNFYGIKFILELCCANELSGAESAYSPWMVNAQGIRTFYVPAADQYLKAFTEECLVRWDGLNFEPGQGNECHDYRMVRVCKEVINETLKAHGRIPWSYADHFKPFFPFELDAPGRAIVKRFGLSGRDLMSDCRTVRDTPSMFDTLNTAEKTIINKIASATTASPLHEMKKDVGRMWGDEMEGQVRIPSHHCTDEKDGQVILPVRYYGKERNYKIVLSNDGVFDGDGPDCQISHPLKCRNSKEQLGRIVEYVLKNKWQGEVIFEITPENSGNLALQVETIKYVSEKIHALTGSYPVNYGKHPKPVEPEPPTPEPVKPPFNFIGWLSNNRGYISAAILLGLIIIAFAC